MNEVHISGRVMKVWDFRGDRFARVSVPRDGDRPPKEDGDRFDYITVRFIGGRDRGLEIRVGDDIEVHGFLQSRDYAESLADFLKDARPQVEVRVEKADPEEVRAGRATTEVVAERWRIRRSG
jgi:hypothetical protein